MKKFFCLLLALVLTLGLLAVTASADAGEGTVSVSICVNGEFATAKDGSRVANVPVKVSDLDGNGAFDINEVLIAAHDALYPGGAAAGYASSVTDWGLGMDMLWGDTSYAFGYYANDAMAWGLEDPVADGGSVKAYVFQDKEFYSDVYSYFDKASAEGSSVTLTLYAGSFDENWNVVFAPAAGAAVTVDGLDTGIVTDAEGKATLSFDKAGSYLVSAVSDSAIYVPAACCVTVTDEAILSSRKAGTLGATTGLISPAPGGRTYTVVPGDCLWSIARQFYGSGAKWGDIYYANADTIRNPRLIYAGQVLVIPD